MSLERDRFRIEGSCWCPDTVALGTLRVMGHTEACTTARKGWEANFKHLSEIDRQKREDESAGRQLREAAMRLINVVRNSDEEGK